MSLLRRRSAIAGLSSLPFAAAPLLSARAQAADFPDRPLRFIVGFPPGGPNDLLARIVAPGIADRLKRSVVVENRAGANGEIAAASVAKAPPDGSVFMLASNGSTTVAPALNPNLSYDVRIDFAAVAPVGINPMLLVVRPDLPARNVTELLAIARERPGKLNGASAGAGGATHLALELFKSMGQCRHRARALQGRRPGHGRPDGEHGRHLFRRPVDGAAARQGGQAARPRADLGCSARLPRPTSRRSPSWACRATRPRSPMASSCRPVRRRLWSIACTQPSTHHPIARDRAEVRRARR